MKITKIERQKKNAERYSLYVDDVFWLGVSEAVLVKYSLYKSQEVEQPFLDNIVEAEFEYTLYNRAIKYLAHGLKTVYEVQVYLQKYMAELEENRNDEKDEQYIQTVIDKLLSQKYLDDKMYSESYVRTQANLNYKGPYVIERELVKKGVGREIVLDVLDSEYSEAQQLENLTHLISLSVRSKSRYSTKLLKQKTKEKMVQKGYERSMIYPLVEEIIVEEDDEEQFELLTREAEKLYRKWSRTTTGYKLKQKCIEGLLRRGFEYDNINEWIWDNDEYWES